MVLPNGKIATPLPLPAPTDPLQGQLPAITSRAAICDVSCFGAAITSDPSGKNAFYLQILGGAGFGGVVDLGAAAQPTSGGGFGSRLVFGSMTYSMEQDLINHQVTYSVTRDAMDGIFGPKTGLALASPPRPSKT